MGEAISCLVSVLPYICDALRDLVPLTYSLKNVRNTLGGVSLLGKLQALAEFGHIYFIFCSVDFTDVFRDTSRPCQIYLMGLFGENSRRFLVFNGVCKERLIIITLNIPVVFTINLDIFFAWVTLPIKRSYKKVTIAPSTKVRAFKNVANTCNIILTLN